MTIPRHAPLAATLTAMALAIFGLGLGLCAGSPARAATPVPATSAVPAVGGVPDFSRITQQYGAAV
ncbi:MAG: peptidase, partial [Sphaerotilus sp.]